MTANYWHSNYEWRKIGKYMARLELTIREPGHIHRLYSVCLFVLALNDMALQSNDFFVIQLFFHPKWRMDITVLIISSETACHPSTRVRVTSARVSAYRCALRISKCQWLDLYDVRSAAIRNTDDTLSITDSTRYMCNLYTRQELVVAFLHGSIDLRRAMQDALMSDVAGFIDTRVAFLARAKLGTASEDLNFDYPRLQNLTMRHRNSAPASMRISSCPHQCEFSLILFFVNFSWLDYYFLFVRVRNIEPH